MSLSQPTISTIVLGLLRSRESLEAELRFWSDCTRPADKTLYCQQINQSLNDNASALIELANGIAPWLKQHPDYASITNTKESA